jgi:AcrR family transcriptional regulator
VVRVASARRYGGKSAEQRRAERRASLVNVARELWREQGWAAVTMRGVCARARLTDRYFYESFKDRDALLIAVWDQMRDDVLNMLLAEITAHADDPALEQLDAALNAIVHRIGDDPGGAQILFGDHAGSAVLEKRRRETIRMSVDLFVDLSRPYLHPGVDESDFRMNVIVGIGGFVEAMLAWRSGVLEATADELVASLSAMSAALGKRFLNVEQL